MDGERERERENAGGFCIQINKEQKKRYETLVIWEILHCEESYNLVII